MSSARDTIPSLPVTLGSKAFNRDKFSYYDWMLREAPVCRGKLSLLNVTLVAPYDLCRSLLQDPRLVRNRTNATGGSPFPVPLPKSVHLLMKGLISQDDPNHKRQRALVAKAFTPKALERMAQRIDAITDDLLDGLEGRPRVELLEAYCLPLPVAVIRELLGVEPEDMPRFLSGLTALTDGLTGFNMLRTVVWDLPRLVKFVGELLEAKRRKPGDDLLTGLLQAEEGGDQLSHEELIALTFTLIIAGYETTVHLIGNAVVALLQHPAQLERLRAEPTLLDGAIEETLRWCGPVQSTKLMYAAEDLEIGGALIKRGSAVVPLLGAANRDPAQFPNPEVFDLARTPNKHLGFGFGPHHCLGAALARMEARAAVGKLLARAPGLRLEVPPAALELQSMLLWHRYKALPVLLGGAP